MISRCFKTQLKVVKNSAFVKKKYYKSLQCIRKMKLRFKHRKKREVTADCLGMYFLSKVVGIPSPELRPLSDPNH